MSLMIIYNFLDCCIALVANIVQDIYGNLIQNKEFNNEIAKCAILSARNADVEEIIYNL